MELSKHPQAIPGLEPGVKYSLQGRCQSGACVMLFEADESGGQAEIHRDAAHVICNRETRAVTLPGDDWAIYAWADAPACRLVVTRAIHAA